MRRIGRIPHTYLQNEEAKNAIIAATGNSQIHTYTLDLSLQADVKRFAKDISGKFSKIHYLINNSGISGLGKRTMTKDGYESIISTNYLGTDCDHISKYVVSE